MIVKVHGLVVKTYNSKENDKYLTILTKEYGKMSLRAAGVRSYKSKYMTATQLFSYSEFTLMKTENFCKMNEAAVIENFYDIRLDIKKLALAAYLTDVAAFVSVEERDDDGILNLLLNTLFMVSYKDTDIDVVKAVFELKLMALTGFMPNVDECGICVEDTADKVYYFDYIGGGLICEDCFRKLHILPPETRRIDNDLIKLIKFVSSSEIKKVFSFRLDDSLNDVFKRMSEHYLLSQTAHKFASLDYYKTIQRN